MMTVPPAGMVGAATAVEAARARGVQHLGDPASAGFRHASPSALGAELSDDSLTMSPEEQLPQKRGATQRDASARLPTGKRLALSQPRPTRRNSPSAHEGRERSPRARGPKSLEERVLAIELQSAYDRNAQQAFQAELDGHVQISLDLRREVFGTGATVSDAMATIEAKFSTMEGQLESKIASMDGQMAALQRSIEQAQAQLPMDGRVVQETFSSIAAELESLKSKQGETITKGMVTELELMHRNVADHEAGLLIENLGFAYAKLADTVEKSVAPPDGANIPETRSDWQRPPRRTTGMPNEQSYGGCGGCPGSVRGRSGGLGLTGAWNSGSSGGGLGGSGSGGCGGHS